MAKSKKPSFLSKFPPVVFIWNSIVDGWNILRVLLVLTVTVIFACVMTYIFTFEFEEQDTEAVRQEEIAELVGAVKARSPGIAKSLDEMKQKYGEGSDAYSTVMTYYRRYYKGSAPALLVEALARDVSAPMQIARYAALCETEDLGEEYKDMVETLINGATDPNYNTISDPCIRLVDVYLTDLEKARQVGGGTWETVKANPLSLQAFHILWAEPADDEADKLWELYMKDAAWMQHAFLLLCSYEVADVQDGTMDNTQKLREFLRMCSKYPSMCIYAKQVVTDWTTSNEKNPGNEEAQQIAFVIPYMFTAYLSHGDTIQALYTKTAGAPVNDCVDAVLCNADLIEEKGEAEFLDTAQKVWFNYGRHAGTDDTFTAWDAVCTTQDALLLYAMDEVDTPDVLKRFPNAIPLIISAASEDSGKLDGYATRNILAAVRKYDIVALSVISEHSEHPKFLEVARHGPKVFPYIAIKGEAAFPDLLKDNWESYVDKEIDADGNLKKNSWENILVVGGLGTVCVNLYHGYPITLGEIGWAALDLTDVAIFIPGGQGVGAAKAAAKAGAKKAIKSAAKTSAKNAGKAELKNVRKQVAKQGTKKGGKQAAKKSSKLLKRLGPACKEWAVGSWKYVTKAGKTLRGAYYALKGAATLRRALACVGIALEFVFKTAPNLDAIYHDISSLFRNGIKKAINIVKEGANTIVTTATNGHVTAYGLIRGIYATIATGIWGVLLMLLLRAKLRRLQHATT